MEVIFLVLGIVGCNSAILMMIQLLCDDESMYIVGENHQLKYFLTLVVM
jgi:hypothetical protein